MVHDKKEVEETKRFLERIIMFSFFNLFFSTENDTDTMSQINQWHFSKHLEKNQKF